MELTVGDDAPQSQPHPPLESRPQTPTMHQPQSMPPSNRASTERFPDFLFTCPVTTPALAESEPEPGAVAGLNYSDWADDRSSTPAPSLSRSSTISTVSTATTSIFPSSPHFDQYDPFQRSRPHSCSTASSVVSAGGTASPTPRSRRDKQHLHAVRLQRSGTNGLLVGSKPTTPPKKKRFQRSCSSPADALAAIEPPHDQGLTKMAFAEQQRWITVQQKTFTKW